MDGHADLDAPRISANVTGSHPFVDVVRRSFDDALANVGKLDDHAFAIEGLCGRKHRMLLNNLVANLPDPQYLEIGIFRGATLCAAIYKNVVRVVGIDNWSEFPGANGSWLNAIRFYNNLATMKGQGSRVTIVEDDFRNVRCKDLGPFNIGFYDGSHSEEDQYDGARAVLGALDPQAVLMIDDWNWQAVRDGTARALRDEGVQVLLEIEVRTTSDGSLPKGAAFGGKSDWHNGVYMAVVAR